MKRPTQKDVARLAGVSRSTVSFVVRGQPDQNIPISEETRQKVLDAIATLGYEPDLHAQTLRRGTTKTIGVLFPTLHNPHFVHVLSGIQSEAAASGYEIHLSRSSLTPEEEQISLSDLIQHQVDGFILLTHFKLLPKPMLKQILNSGQPVVQITTSGSEFDHVLNSYAAGTQALMTHLFELGHKRIGFVYGVAHESQGLDRLMTYRQSLQDAGLQEDKTLVQYCGLGMEDGYQAARTLLSRPDRPTALLVVSDVLAIAVIRAAADLGLHVPGDVSIASFDDIPYSSYTMPHLTTVSAFPEQNGRDAVKLLLRRLDNPNRPVERIIAQTELKIRESTGPVK
jgi:LacI family transcriptional regulator